MGYGVRCVARSVCDGGRSVCDARRFGFVLSQPVFTGDDGEKSLVTARLSDKKCSIVFVLCFGIVVSIRRKNDFFTVGTPKF